MSRQDFDAQQSTEGLEGKVKADQASVDNAKLNLAYCRITAPIPGRVGLRLVDPGNMVHPGDANGLLVITQLKPITVLFTIPEDNLPQVIKRQHSSSKWMSSAATTNKLATGTLTTINNQWTRRQEQCG